jgi:hypothetical protein
MATWIAHLRVAENILNILKDIDKIPFVAGNIAPDSGVPNEDASSFSPPVTITHWKDENDIIDAEGFYNKYVKSSKAMDDREFYSFALGYYIHLLTDIEWSNLYQVKKEEPLYKDNLSKDPKFIWRIKDDWYGQDYVFLKENQDSIFFNCFQHIVDVKDYLDYFPKGAFAEKFRYIREMYLEDFMNPPNEFIYLSKDEMDSFVQNATASISDILNAK